MIYTNEKQKKRNYAHTNKRHKNFTRENPRKHAGANEAGGKLRVASLARGGAAMGKRIATRPRGETREPKKVMTVMLAKTYTGRDPTGWMMSEKLDGVRALWDGKKLMSRNGNQFHAPPWFTALLPKIPLDGELWLGRGQFQKTVSIVKKKKTVDDEWMDLIYRVFDAPEQPGRFVHRLADCRELLDKQVFARVVDHVACASAEHLSAFYKTLVFIGAEGVMLRHPRSAYKSGRSDQMLKMKPLETAEAIVTGHELGKGRIAEIIGAVQVEWGGHTFRLGAGMSDDARRNPPPIGAAVTFGYSGLTDSGQPRFPTFQAVRDYE